MFTLYVLFFFNACHPEVFNTYIKYTMMCQSNTTNLYYVFLIVLGQHVSILIESSSGPSKKLDPYLEMFKCAVGSQTLTCKHLGSHSAF